MDVPYESLVDLDDFAANANLLQQFRDAAVTAIEHRLESPEKYDDAISAVADCVLAFNANRFRITRLQLYLQFDFEEAWGMMQRDLRVLQNERPKFMRGFK
jgi:hypothetical protein